MISHFLTDPCINILSVIYLNVKLFWSLMSVLSSRGSCVWSQRPQTCPAVTAFIASYNQRLQLLTHPPTRVHRTTSPLLTPQPWCVSLKVVTVRDGTADTRALKQEAFVFGLLLSLSLSPRPLQPVAMWPIDPWLDWSLTAIEALSHWQLQDNMYTLCVLKYP